MTDAKSHQRVNDILLGPLERPALLWLSAHMPAWINPDILTLIGILGAVIICAGYILSGVSSAFLWLATLGFVINWFGDSLDGSLARYRQIERPKYGFFVDHTVDAFSQLLIFMGLGLSPYVSFSVAALALVGYLLMTVLVYVDTFVSGVFKISYGKFGPTEMRVLAILVNAAFFFVGRPIIETALGPVALYDLVVLAIALAFVLVFLISTTRRARELARLEEGG